MARSRRAGGTFAFQTRDTLTHAPLPLAHLWRPARGQAGDATRLSGWCHRIRDHGGVLFIDLRDHYGMTQCVVDPDSPAFAQAERCARNGWCASTARCVSARPAPRTPTCRPAQVEVYVAAIEVLGPAAELPLPVFGEPELPEDIRLKYRFLDLRRDKLHATSCCAGGDRQRCARA